MYRTYDGELQVFLVHPGRPYWAKKNEGSWTLPKGEYESDEDPIFAVTREFQEGTGFAVSEHFVELGSVQQKAESWLRRGHLKVIATLQNLSATLAKWSDHHDQSNSWRFLIDRSAWFTTTEAVIFLRKE